MYLTGFADEASDALAGQIEATRSLGWRWIESRRIGDTNIHDIDDAAFDQVVDELAGSGVGINCFGSTVANWANSVTDPWEKTREAVERCISRMKRPDVPLIRVMSYKVEHEAPSYSDEDQQADERFRRMRDFVQLFLDNGIQPVHENCMNYGGMGPGYTLRMLENVPGLKLVFDTGNPVFTPDYAAGATREEGPRQDAWDFYQQVQDHIAYVHIKDGVYEGTGKTRFTWPGEGDGHVERILADLLGKGYDGGISMEPHLKVVYHEQATPADQATARAETYIEYGRRFMALLERIGHPLDLDRQTGPEAVLA
ncbi:MAG: sugar phosphate isomerase/epimerase family protein [Planctomycetota bacterium]